MACSGPEPRSPRAHVPTDVLTPAARVVHALQPADAPWRAAAVRSDWEQVAVLIDALPDALKAQPTSRFARAEAAARLGDCVTVLDALVGVEVALPLLAPDVARMRAECQLELGPFDAAAKYHAALGTASADLRAARAWLRAGRPDHAAPLVGDLLKRLRRKGAGSATYVAARRLRAELSERAGRLDRAIDDYLWLATEGRDAKAALEYERLAGKPLSAAERLSRARAFAKRGDVAQVERELERAREARGRRPTPTERMRVLARAVYESRADNARAAALFEQLARNTGYSEPSDAFMAARAHIRDRKLDDAAALYQKIAKVHRGTRAEERARYGLARLSYERGDWERAERGYTRYLERYGARRRPWRGRFCDAARYERAVARLALGRYDRALDDLKRLEPSARHSRGLLRHLEAVALVSSGAAELEARALEHFEAVVRERPLSFEALASAARLEQLGRSVPPLPPLPELDAGPLAELPPRVQLLASLGLYSAAERALAADEAALSRRYHPRARQTLCQLYGAVERGGRAYAALFGRLQPGALLVRPTASSLWAWQCMYPRPYATAVAEIEERFALPTELVYSVMRQESAFRADARSHAGAVGLMQLMPSTAERAARELSKVVAPEQLTLPRYNLELGAHYLSTLLGEFERRVVLALAGYNAGPHAVARWLDGGSDLPLDLWVARIPYTETRGYVMRVMSNWARYRYLARGPEHMPRLELRLPAELEVSSRAY